MNRLDSIYARLGVYNQDGLPGPYRGEHRAASKNSTAWAYLGVLVLLGGTVAVSTIRHTPPASAERTPNPPAEVAELNVEFKITHGSPVQYMVGVLAMPDADVCVHNPVVEKVQGRWYWLQLGRTQPDDPATVTAITGSALTSAQLTNVREGALVWQDGTDAYLAAGAGAVPEYVGAGVPTSGGC